MKLALALALTLLALPLSASPKPKKQQTQPEPKRIAEIQQALAEHGYSSGDTWRETREICRHIADDHGWQNMWAPDARVLALLGLGKNLDPDTASMKPNSLDSDERKWVEAHGGEQAWVAK